MNSSAIDGALDWSARSCLTDSPETGTDKNIHIELGCLLATSNPVQISDQEGRPAG
jgi:hypothetical protein